MEGRSAFPRVEGFNVCLSTGSVSIAVPVPANHSNMMNIFLDILSSRFFDPI
jgi:hypothetical protein